NLTPQAVLDRLREGNRRFVAGEVTLRDHTEQVRKAASGQFPKAVILSCLDSRIPVEDVFDCGIGDLFVARVAGNFANTDIIASMEFACKAAGAKLVLVLGHGLCGAVKGAIDQVELGHLPSLFEKIEPAVERALKDAGDLNRSSENAMLVQSVVEHNVDLTVEYIRKNSEVLLAMEQDGDIAITGAVYDMETGEVLFRS
ncbi:carbonic anhydrase family protein, partial [Qipengyuania sp.]|uniref:carbonic anhydrase family protein n=1 Tax=Qipengyuania sp. TaxID=2004515 RepID=UPI003736A708